MSTTNTELKQFLKGKTFSGKTQVYAVARKLGIKREHAATTRAREKARKMLPLWNKHIVPVEQIAKKFGISAANVYVRIQKYKELFPEMGFTSRWPYAKQ